MYKRYRRLIFILNIIYIYCCTQWTFESILNSVNYSYWKIQFITYESRLSIFYSWCISIQTKIYFTFQLQFKFLTIRVPRILFLVVPGCCLLILEMGCGVRGNFSMKERVNFKCHVESSRPKNEVAIRVEELVLSDQTTRGSRKIR